MKKKKKPVMQSIRKSWGIRPVTKVKESKKVYKRENRHGTEA